MTPEAQRIAIAEACGWKAQDRERGDGVIVIYFLSPTGTHANDIPDYLNDLNAMHEVETSVRFDQFQAVHYPHEVFKAVTGLEWKGDMGYFFPMVIRATAAQRAEAFLKTLGKWTE